MNACVYGFQGRKRDDLHFFAALSTLPHVQLCFRSPDTSPGSPRIRLRLRMYLYPLGCCRSQRPLPRLAWLLATPRREASNLRQLRGCRPDLPRAGNTLRILCRDLRKNPLPMHTLVDHALQNHILYHMLLPSALICGQIEIDSVGIPRRKRISVHMSASNNWVK